MYAIRSYYERLGIFLFEQINQAHLSHNNHSFLVFVQPLNEVVVVAVVHVQPLVAGHYAYFGQCFGGKLEQRFRQRHVNVYRPFTVMVYFQKRFVDQSVAIPFVFLRMYLR